MQFFYIFPYRTVHVNSWCLTEGNGEQCLRKPSYVNHHWRRWLQFSAVSRRASVCVCVDVYEHVWAVQWVCQVYAVGRRPLSHRMSPAAAGRHRSPYDTICHSSHLVYPSYLLYQHLLTACHSKQRTILVYSYQRRRLCDAYRSFIYVSVCLSVRLYVFKVTQKVMDKYWSNFRSWPIIWAHPPTTPYLLFRYWLRVVVVMLTESRQLDNNETTYCEVSVSDGCIVRFAWNVDTILVQRNASKYLIRTFI